MLDYSRDGRAADYAAPRDRVGYRRIIHEQIPLERIDACDADFYRENQSRSCYYVSLQGEREAYFRDNPCTVMLFNCMDGRERDAARALGIPPGAENIYATAGNKIGDVNLVLCKEIQARIDRAAAAGKRVLILFTTHESWSKRDTDSCAAWGNQGQLAAEDADMQVRRFNADYVDRDGIGRVTKRHVIAIRLNSFTDTENRVWHGVGGRTVDPMEFVQRMTDRTHDLDGYNIKAVSAEMLERFKDVFPREDDRFGGLEDKEYEAVLLQIARMAEANVRYIRQAAKTNPTDLKNGHREKRVLVGRGWEMYDDPNEYFIISDFTPELLREGKIAVTYVLKNSIMAMLEGRPGLHVPIHINVPYDRERPGDRGGSIRHAMGLGRALRADWLDRLGNPDKCAAFLSDLMHALKHDGVDINGLPSPIWDGLNFRLMDALKFYISVSPRETRLLELVATGGDL